MIEVTRSQSYKQTSSFPNPQPGCTTIDEFAAPTVEFMSLSFTEDPTAASVSFEETALYTSSHFESGPRMDFRSIGENPMEDLEPDWARSGHDWPTTLSDNNFTPQPKHCSLGKRRWDSDSEEDRPNPKRQRTVPIDPRPRRRSARIANASVVHSKVASIPLPTAPRRKRPFEDVERSADEIGDDILRYTKRRITGRSS